VVQVKKVVIDTNTLISAFGWGGNPREVLRLLEKRKIINYTSAELLDELKRVISYPKLRFSNSLQNQIIEFVLLYSEIVEPREKLLVVKDDPEDNRILECALEPGAEFIVSGDMHILNLKEYRGIKIVTAAELIKHIKQA
jgi:putative PIN family toxin of toxin-antitoxin system